VYTRSYRLRVAEGSAVKTLLNTQKSGDFCKKTGVTNGENTDNGRAKEIQAAHGEKKLIDFPTSWAGISNALSLMSVEARFQ
jgi:hypothetical protein